MTSGLLSSQVPRPPSAWLPPAAEADAYEGIRRGEDAAFRAVARPLQPVLRRLAGLTVSSAADADDVVLRTWSAALRTLDMFRWRTPFATWVAAITIAQGRTRAARDRGPPRSPAAPVPAHSEPGPADWSDLPWGARWEHALATLVAAHAALPLPQREVVHTRDLERWPPRRVCDVLGLPEVVYERLLADGRAELREALAPLVVEAGRERHEAAQTAAVVRVLGELVDDREEPLDPRTLAVFRRWRATRVPGWRRLGGRLLGPPSWAGWVVERSA